MAVETVGVGSGQLISLLGVAGAVIAYFISRDISKKDKQDELKHAADVVQEARLTRLEEGQRAREKADDDLWTEISVLRDKSEKNAADIKAHLAVCDERTKKGHAHP